MDKDLPQPASKCARSFIMLEVGQLLRNDKQHILDEIIGVSAGLLLRE